MPVSIIHQIRRSFESWLSLKDADIIDIICATVIANRLPGEPLWLAVVGPSGSGKTEMVRALKGCQRTHMIDKITPSTFVSGFKADPTKKKKKGDGNGHSEQVGLLHKMMDGKAHMLVIEDFSTVLGKRKEVKGEVMSELRKLYDGEYTAHYGNEVFFDWHGKIGIIACSTGVYDREMGVQSAFGDRFLVIRQLVGDPVVMAERSGRNSEESGKMRNELEMAMSKLDRVKIPERAIELNLEVRTMVARLTAFVSISRTQVLRDSFRREVEAVPEPEGTGRMGAQLHQLLRGLCTLRGHKQVTEGDIETVEMVALGTIPSLRLRVMRQFDLVDPTLAASIKGVPHTVLYRTLQDLEMLGLIEHDKHAGHSQKGWYEPVGKWKPFFHFIQKQGYDL